jgi:hypothetical protein
MYLLDSNILIYALLAGNNDFRDLIAKKKSACSIVSKIEVLGYHKLSAEEKEAFEYLFNNITILPLNSVIAQITIKLRQVRKISLGDAIIAATAGWHKAELLTANTKDFNKIEHLKIKNPIY